jgi:hypothetical protein
VVGGEPAGPGPVAEPAQREERLARQVSFLLRAGVPRRRRSAASSRDR